MSTPNKYHPTGRLYTADELGQRRWALIPTYLVRGYVADPLKRIAQGKLLPYNVGKNATKRAARDRRASLRKLYGR